VYIFYCAGGKFGEVVGVTQVLVAPDAAPACLVRCLTLARVSQAHRTLAPDAGRTLSVHPMVHDISKCARGVSNCCAPDASGVVACVHPVTLQVCGALCARVRCAPDASGEN